MIIDLDKDYTTIGELLEHKGLSDDEIDAYFLEHYGVKGMRWGVRQARKEVLGQSKRSRQIIREAKKAKTKTDRDAAIKRYETEVIARIKSKDFREAYKTANTLTKGDMAAQVLMTGPWAALTIPAMRNQFETNRRTGIDHNLVAAKDILRELKDL